MAMPFGAHITADEALEGADLRGRRILVTGAFAGIGLEATRTLLARGAQVVGAVRGLDEARAATAPAPQGTANGGELTLVHLDLASLASVRACAAGLVAAGVAVDVVIANTVIMFWPKGTTAEGFETQFGTNHLEHFVLVNHLLPLLKPRSRVVNLSSAAHRHADVDLDDPNVECTPYSEVEAYRRSKTANILFTVALDGRLKGKGMRAAAVTPGVTQTELGRHMTPEVMRQIMPALPQGRKSVAQGAASVVWCGFIAAADAVGGRYCEDCHVAEINEDLQSGAGVRATRSIPRAPKRFGQKARKWSENGSKGYGSNGPKAPFYRKPSFQRWLFIRHHAAIG